MRPETAFADMKRLGFAALIVSCACLASHVEPAHSAERPVMEEYLQYVPQSLATGETPRDDGVLVKKILIRHGDTLSRLSRYYSGKGHYYPQILLFNRIANPDLIHAGRELYVPVTSHPSRKALERSGAGKNLRTAGKDVSAPAKSFPAGKEGKADGREPAEYLQAVALFSAGKYREAIAAFTRFIDEHPQSPLVSDALLYRADSYLRLSR